MPAKEAPSAASSPQMFLRASTRSSSSPRVYPRLRSDSTLSSDTPPRTPTNPHSGDSPHFNKWERLHRGVPTPGIPADHDTQPMAVPAEDAPSKGDPTAEPKPPVEAFQYLEISEPQVKAPKKESQLKGSKPEVKDVDTIVDSSSKVILNKAKWKPKVEASLQWRIPHLGKFSNRKSKLL